MDQIQWDNLARAWPQMASPLRPCAEDIAALTSIIAKRFRAPLKGLLLGVTPEIALGFATSSPLVDLTALDGSAGMIRLVWPGDSTIRRAVLGDWFALPEPFEPASFDVVFCDGGLVCFYFPDEYKIFADLVASALNPGGLLLARVYCRPEKAEPLDAIWADLDAKKIGSVDALKWRIAMALQGDDPKAGVRRSAIGPALQVYARTPQEFANKSGLPVGRLRLVTLPVKDTTTHSFPTVAETMAAIGEHFELLEQIRGKYELADRCPLLVLRRR
jgi:hypothetical protein